MKNFFLIEKVSLKKYNSLRLNSIAEKMIFPVNNDGVKEVFSNLHNNFIILGKGTNVLLKKKLYENENFINLSLMNNIEVKNNEIFCEAGATLKELSWFALESNSKGYEFIEDIPGTLGGAIVMNAGTYRDNISQVLNKVLYYDVEKDEIITREILKKDFGRRTSFFDGGKKIVLGAYLKYEKGDYLKILEKLLEIKKDRYLKQPRNYPNAGSVFKRKEELEDKGLQIWKMVNDSGLRGCRVGDAMISEKHTGFMINLGNARYEDFKELIEICKKKIKENYGIELELEWKII